MDFADVFSPTKTLVSVGGLGTLPPPYLDSQKLSIVISKSNREQLTCQIASVFVVISTDTVVYKNACEWKITLHGYFHIRVKSYAKYPQNIASLRRVSCTRILIFSLF